MAGVQFKPGKMGKITEMLNGTEIGIDGKTYPVAAARLSGIQGADPKIGEDCEYKVAYQGPDKGAIIFFSLKRATPPQTAEKAIPAAKPIDEGLQHGFNDPAGKPSPRTVIGVYIDKSSTQVTVKESDGVNHVYPCDISLLQYLSKKDIPVKKGETYTFELIPAGDKWVAMKVGPAPEGFAGFKTGKEILQENLDSMKSTTVPPESVPKVLVKEESLDEFNDRMAKKAQEQRAQEKAAAEVKAKEDAEADKRMAENAKHAQELAQTPPSEPTGIDKIVAETKARKEASEKAMTVPNTTVIDTGKNEDGMKVFDEDQINLIKSTVAKDCTNTEFKLLMYLASQYHLDPLRKQIWAVKYGDEAAAIFTGRDGFLQIAHRSGQLDGMESGVKDVVTDKDGKITEMIGWCKVYRKDMAHPFSVEVYLSEFIKVPRSGKQGNWQKMPRVMIQKVAESTCLRRAFAVSGLYSPEEMEG